LQAATYIPLSFFGSARVAIDGDESWLYRAGIIPAVGVTAQGKPRMLAGVS
jgi:hypothetical protein